MPKKNKSFRKKKSSKRERINIPSASTRYTGPYRLPAHSMNLDRTVAELTNSFAFTSTSGGVQQQVIANNLASFIDSTSYTALYDEYRCLSMEATYYPILSGATISGVTYQLAYGVVDNDSSGVLTSVNNAIDFASVKIFPLDSKMTLRWKMNGVEDADFTDSNTVATVYFKYFSSGLSNSTNYGNIIVKTLWQFRGRI
jgi:hypothetical protein